MIHQLLASTIKRQFATMGQKRSAAEQYENDDGFVEDAPRSKKTKPAPKSSSIVLEEQKDDEGNAFWEVSWCEHSRYEETLTSKSRSHEPEEYRSQTSKARRWLVFESSTKRMARRCPAKR